MNPAATKAEQQADGRVGGRTPEELLELADRISAKFNESQEIKSKPFEAFTPTADTERSEAVEAERAKRRGRPPARDLLLAALEDAGLRLYQANGEAYASIRVDGHQENHRLRAASFSMAARILAHRAGAACSRNAVDEVLDALEARAFAEGVKTAAYRRAGPALRDTVTVCDGRDGDFYCVNGVNQIVLDPGRPDWRFYLLGTGEGPRLIDSDDPRAPLLVRGPAFAPLPEPTTGGALEELFEFVNVVDEDRLLVLAALMHAWRPGVAQPIVNPLGEHGSLKTSSVRAARALIDPSHADVGTLPRTADELFVVGASSIVAAFDNASHLDAELSDALCVLATGGSRLTRKLYSDGDLSVISARAQVWLNGISDLVTRGDLASRAVILNCPPLEPSRRRSDADVRAAFATAAPRIFGALLERVDVTLATPLPSVQQEKRERPRLADYSDTGEALARSLGYAPGTFDELLIRNQNQAADTVLESSPVAEAIMRRVRERGPIDMSPSGLLPELTALAGEAAHARSWPGTPVALAGAVRRIAPALRAAGFNVETGRNHAGRYLRVSTIRTTVTPVTERHAVTQPEEAPHDIW